MLISQLPGKLCLLELLLLFLFYIVVKVIKLIKNNDLFNPEIKKKAEDGNSKEEETNNSSELNIEEDLNFNLFMHILSVGIFLASPNNHLTGIIFCYVYFILFLVYFVFLYKKLKLYSFFPFVLGIVNMIIIVIGLNQKRISINY